MTSKNIDLFNQKIVKSIVYDERFELQIIFTDDSVLTVSEDGPEGSHIKVHAKAVIDTDL